MTVDLWRKGGERVKGRRRERGTEGKERVRKGDRKGWRCSELPKACYYY